MDETTKTVLLVDHNEDNRTVYRAILEHFGYRVLEARNGEDAVRVTRDEHPDLLLLRRGVPLLDGHAVTRMLKSDPATASIPVILMTAAAMAHDRAAAHEAGCDGYLATPVEPRRVVAEVERFIGSGR